MEIKEYVNFMIHNYKKIVFINFLRKNYKNQYLNDEIEFIDRLARGDDYKFFSWIIEVHKDDLRMHVFLKDLLSKY